MMDTGDLKVAGYFQVVISLKLNNLVLEKISSAAPGVDQQLLGKQTEVGSAVT